VVAGTAMVDGRDVVGPIGQITTRPMFLDVCLPDGGEFRQSVPAGHNAFVYPYEGRVAVGDAVIASQQAGILSPGDQVTLRALGGEARFLLLAARPLGEPVVQYGPFVMNTRDEIEQAIRDYQNGTLAAVLP